MFQKYSVTMDNVNEAALLALMERTGYSMLQVLSPVYIYREFKFYKFFSLLKFNEFYQFFFG